MADDKEKSVKDMKQDPLVSALEELPWVGITLTLLGILAFIPTAIAYLVWRFITATRLRLFEYIAIATTAVLALLLTAGQPLKDYLHWFWNLPFGSHQVWPLPWIGLLTLSALVLGAVGAVGTERVLAKVPALIGQAGSDSVIPRDSEMKRTMVRPVKPVMINPHEVKSGVTKGDIFIPLGQGRRGEPVGLFTSTLKAHGMIFGGTGSGKTESIKTLMFGMADAGYNILLLDLKQDLKEVDGLRDSAARYAAVNSRPYQELHLAVLELGETGYWFNALAGLSRDQAVQLMLSLVDHDDNYYRSVSESVTRAAATVFYNCYTLDPSRYAEPSIYEMGRALQNLGTMEWKRRFSDLKDFMGVDPKSQDYVAVFDPTDAQKTQAASMGTKLTNIYSEEVAPYILRSSPGSTALDVTKDGIIYIGLDTLGLADMSKVISTSVLLRLAAEAGKRTNDANARPLAIIIDEANWINRIAIENLLSRARGANMSVTLCTQSPLDFRDKDGDYFLKFSQNVNFMIVMRQPNPEAAEIMAEYLGSEKKAQRTYRVDAGQVAMESGSVSEKKETIIDSEELRNLGTGQAVIRSGPGQPLKWARIFQRKPDQALHQEF